MHIIFFGRPVVFINWGKVKKNQGNLIIGLEMASILMTRGRKRSPGTHRVKYFPDKYGFADFQNNVEFTLWSLLHPEITFPFGNWWNFRTARILISKSNFKFCCTGTISGRGTMQCELNICHNNIQLSFSRIYGDDDRLVHVPTMQKRS